MADVTDKGMPAALFMALSRSIVRASVAGATSPAEGIARANRLICADSSQGMFVTLFYALLNPAARELTYVNAGHNPPLLCRAGHVRPTQLTLTGIPLGIESDVTYEQRTLHLIPGDLILLYTDGVTDAMNAQGQDFGMERLERVLQEQFQSPAAEVLAALEGTLDEFTGPTAPFDDMAMMVVRCPG